MAQSLEIPFLSLTLPLCLGGIGRSFPASFVSGGVTARTVCLLCTNKYDFQCRTFFLQHAAPVCKDVKVRNASWENDDDRTEEVLTPHLLVLL